MGWASSADYMQGTTMAFRSKEDAVAFVSPIIIRPFTIFRLEHSPCP